MKTMRNLFSKSLLTPLLLVLLLSGNFAQEVQWNLAYEGIISASGFTEGNFPENLINANSPLCWTVEGGGFQWLDIRFKTPVNLEGFELTIVHEYLGEAIEIYGRNINSEYFLIHRFENEQLMGDTALSHSFPQAYTDIEFIRIESPESPVYLCWRDLGLIGNIPLRVPPPGGFEIICDSAPDAIYYNANIITMDDALPTAEAIAIKRDKIIAAGTSSDMLDLRVPSCPVSTHDMNGLTLLPGFNDNHNHVFTWPEEICKATGDTSYPELSTRIADIAQFGWTSISDMGFGIPQDGSNEHIYNALNLDLHGQLPFRLNGYFGSVLDLETFDILSDSGRTAGRQYSGRLKTPGVKLYIDHPLGVDAGPYTQEDVNALVQKAQDNAWQIAAHAVNTEGIEKILTAYELALGSGTNELTRYRIEHAVKISDAQLERMENKGIIASFQLLGPPDWPTQQTHIDFISNTNPEWQMRWRELVDSGVPSVGSTDYPFNNAPCNYSPFRAIYEAVTRKGYIDRVHADWELSQRLTVYQAIKLLTIDGAYATFEEDKKGSITPGKWADFVVVSADPLSLSDPEELLDIEIYMSVIGGITEYCNASLATPICESFETFSINSALVSASDFLESNTPDKAFDKNEETNWGAGNFPPQWILIDLQESFQIEDIELVVDQWPAGYTVHQVLGKNNADDASFMLLHEFAGNTEYGQHLLHTLPADHEALRFVKILTTASPSHVSWKEIYIRKKQDVNQTTEITQSALFDQLSLFPSPVNEQSVLKYSLVTGGRVSIRISNLEGKILGTLHEGYQVAGDYSISLNAGLPGGLVPGVYLMYLETGEGLSIKQFSKLE